jgi:single-strand DNA-binding protein
MASFNKVMLLGNLTRDPQLRYLPSNQPIVEIGIACSRKFKTASGEEREETTFVDCTAFGRQAEVINQYCTKGRPLFIEGRLKLDQWEDKTTQAKRSKLSVVIENFQLLGGRDGGGGRAGGDGADGEMQGAPAGGPLPARGPGRAPAQRPSRPQADAPFDEGQQFKDEDIPF